MATFRQNFVQTQNKQSLENQPMNQQTPNSPKLLEASSLASESLTSNHLSLVPHLGQVRALTWGH